MGLKISITRCVLKINSKHIRKIQLQEQTKKKLSEKRGEFQAEKYKGGRGDNTLKEKQT